jgi:ABC-2 type transport system permease protein
MGFFFSFIFPLAMTFLLGNMLANYDNPDARIDTINIAIVSDAPANPASEATIPASEAANPTGGEAGGRFANGGSGGDIVTSFTDAMKGNGNIKFTKTANPDAARKSVDDGTNDAAMLFDSSLDIKVYGGTDSIKTRAVTLIAQSFSREYQAYSVAAQANPDAFARLMAKQATSATAGLPNASELTENRDLGVNRSIMDFYAVTILVMIAFMGGGIGGACDMYFARKNGSLRRLTLSPTKRSRLFLDNVIGIIPQNIMQALIMMIPSVLFFGAHYAKTPSDNMLLFAYFVLLGTSVTAVFMLAGLFLKINPMMPLMAVMWVLLFMSGTFSKEVNIPGVTEYIPMNIAQQAAFDLTVFGRPERVLGVMAVCACALIASCVAGSLVLRRKEIAL